MKRKLLLAAIVAVASAIGGGSSAFAQQQGEAFKYNGVRYEVTGENLITNGSFEEGFTGWTSSNDFKTVLSADNFVIKTEGAQEGENYLVGTKSQGATNAASLGTGWDIETNKTYVFSYYIRYNVEESNKGKGDNTSYLKTTLVNTKGGDESKLGTTQSLGEPTVSTDGKWCQFQTVFTNEEYAYLQVSFRWLEKQWGFDNFVLAEVAPRTTILDEDYAELQAAIDNIEQNLGFEAGEYAPYNVPFESLNKAKALVEAQNANKLSEIVELIDELEAVKTNETEVNAIFDGSFELNGVSLEDVAKNTRPVGWYENIDKTTSGTNAHEWYIRYIAKDATSNSGAGLAATSTGNGMMVKRRAHYGCDEQYSMPLKSNTYYVITLKAAGWGGEDNGTRSIEIINPSKETTIIKKFDIIGAKKGNENVSDWSNIEAIFKTDEAGNYVLNLNGNHNNQNQTAYGDIKLVKSTTMPDLVTEVDKANALAKRNVGEGAFQISADADAVKALKTAIETAQGVCDNPTDTQGATDATNALKLAEETYNNVWNTIELNKPAEGEVFNVINVSANYDHAGKALTFKSAKDAEVKEKNIGMGWTEKPGSIYPQDVTFEPVEGETNIYKLSYTRADGIKIYVATGISAGTSDGNINNLRATAGEGAKDKALKVKVAISDKENVWYLYNTESPNGDSYFRIGGNGANDSGFFTGESDKERHKYYDMQLSPAAKHEATIDLNHNYATLVVPFDAEIPEGLEVYSIANAEAVGENGVLTLTTEESIKANTPYIVYGSEETTVAGYGVAYTTTETFTSGLLTGSYYAFNVPANSYILQTQTNDEEEDVQAFYKVSEEFAATPYRAYLTYTPSTGGEGGDVKAIYFDANNATAIQAVPEVAKDAENAVYNLAGQRVANPTKGIYIVNGQKVLVK